VSVYTFFLCGNLKGSNFNTLKINTIASLTSKNKLKNIFIEKLIYGDFSGHPHPRRKVSISHENIHQKRTILK